MVFYAAFNSISVISQRQVTLFMSFLGFISTRLWLWSILPKTPLRKNPEDQVRLEPRIPGLQVKHFTTEPCRTTPLVVRDHFHYFPWVISEYRWYCTVMTIIVSDEQDQTARGTRLIVLYTLLTWSAGLGVNLALFFFFFFLKGWGLKIWWKKEKMLVTYNFLLLQLSNGPRAFNDKDRGLHWKHCFWKKKSERRIIGKKYCERRKTCW